MLKGVAEKELFGKIEEGRVEVDVGATENLKDGDEISSDRCNRQT